MSRNPRYARQILRLVVIAAATFATLSTGARTPAPAATGQSIITLNSAAMSLNAPIVGVAATKSGNGYWRVAADGGVLTAGDAPFYGSAFGKAHAIVIGIAPTPTGKGYWLVDIAGSVYNFGDAAYRGQMWGKRLAKPVVGITGAPDGKGYWLVASDGGIFTFGSAQFYGSTGAIRLKQPVVGIASTPTGKGYWLVASDGGVFTFGNAGFFGSTGAMRLAKPVVGMAASPAGSGYTMVAADGGLFRFGSNMPFYGSAANACPGAPAVGVALSPAAVGYWITFANAMTYAFSPSTRPPTCGPSGTSILDKLAADLFKRVNDERAARNLPALGWDPALASYAKGWSANMAGNGFRHSNISTLLGPYNFVGENIAAGSPGVTAGGLHLAWMHSTGHRANIVSAAFTRVGIGAYCGPDGAIWLTEDFGRPTSAGAAPPMNPNPPEYPIARPDPGTLHC